MELAASLASHGVRLGAELGRGASGVVFAAEGPRGEALALKVVSVVGGARRLRREAAALQALRHPNLVEVHGLIELPGHLVLVMERVEGPDLAAWLQHHTPTLGQVDALFLGMLAGLEAAHAAGWVHRDLKPSNVLLVEVAHPKLADFGLAKPAEDASRATRTGSAMGTPRYMAPEQIRDAKHVDARADLWALGAMLHELLAGEPAFAGAHPVDIWAAIDRGDVVPIETLRPDVPPRMARAIRACLVHEPAHRIPDVAALRALFTGRAQLLLDDEATLVPPEAARRPRRWAWSMLSAAGLGLLGLALVRSDPEPVEVADSTARARFAVRASQADAAFHRPGSAMHARLRIPGDLDGDGHADVVATDAERGGLLVYYGPIAGEVVLSPETADAHLLLGPPGMLGATPMVLGELTGDEAPDLVLGALKFKETGRVLVVPGVSARWQGEVRPSGVLEIAGEAPHRDVGQSVAVLDLTGDGQLDLAYGSPEGRADGGLPGRVWGLAGPLESDLTGADATWVLRGTSLDDQLGGDLVVGDFNGDGAQDLITVPMPRAHDGDRCFLAHGPLSTAMLTDALPSLFRRRGVACFPGAVAAGDVDGDGVSDLLVGHPDHAVDGRADVGAAWLLSGAELPWDAGVEETAAWELVGERTGGRLGQSVAVGDVDHDRLPELFIAQPTQDRVLFFDDLEDVAATVEDAVAVITGVRNTGFGSHVAVVPDVDGDGVDDLLVEAGGFDTERAASAYLFLAR